MADSKVSNLTALASGAVDPISDLLYIVDNSVPEGKKITAANFFDTAVLQRAYTVTINNSAAEADIVNYTVLANTLSTNRVLKTTVFGNYTNGAAGTPTLRLRAYLGGTTLFDDISIATASDADVVPFNIEVLVVANNSAAAQLTNIKVMFGSPVAATTGFGDLATAAGALLQVVNGATSAVDTTANQALRLTLTWSAANAAFTVTKQFSMVELL